MSEEYLKPSEVARIFLAFSHPQKQMTVREILAAAQLKAGNAVSGLLAAGYLERASPRLAGGPLQLTEAGLEKQKLYQAAWDNRRRPEPIDRGAFTALDRRIRHFSNKGPV